LSTIRHSPVFHSLYRKLFSPLIFQFSTSTFESVKRTVFCGVPQGRSFSPCLFNLYILKAAQISSKIIVFGDDVILHQSDSNLANTTAALKYSVSELNSAINLLHLLFVPHKYKSVLFNLRSFNPSVHRIPFNSHFLTTVPFFRYLGVTLVSKLTWKLLILSIRNSSFSVTNILKSFSPYHWDGDPCAVIMFHKNHSFGVLWIMVPYYTVTPPLPLSRYYKGYKIM